MAIRSIRQTDFPRPHTRALLGARILVVEDEILIAMEIACILEECGAEVIGPVHTLDDALREASTQDVAAAVLDMYLGHSGVGPVAAHLQRRAIRFLFYSGQPASDPLRVAWRSTPFLSKPARAVELTQAVTALVAQRDG